MARRCAFVERARSSYLLNLPRDALLWNVARSSYLPNCRGMRFVETLRFRIICQACRDKGQRRKSHDRHLTKQFTHHGAPWSEPE